MTENVPSVTVIVPVFNTGEKLRPCLDSIISQTLGDLDIILVDDGSDDPLTLELVDEYTKKDGRVRSIRKKNEGQSSARNIGIEQAVGRYIAFVDHDDVLNRTMYETLFSAAEKNGADVAECRFEPVNDDQLALMDLSGRPSTPFRSVVVSVENDFLINHIHIWNRLYLKKFLQQNHLNFDDLLWEEDVLFSFKTLISARHLVFSDESLYFHVEHDKNTTHKLGLKIFHTFKAHDLLGEFLEQDEQRKKTFEHPAKVRLLKDVLFGLNLVNGDHEEKFFYEAHERIKDFTLKRYKAYYSKSKKKLLFLVQHGDFKKYKKYKAIRDWRKKTMRSLFSIRWTRHEKSITFLGFKFRA